MAEPALNLSNVHAGYGETVVLEDINLTLNAGETLSIIGRNGVGKSTLLSTIMGHTDVTWRPISLNGKDISVDATYRRVTAGSGWCRRSAKFFPRCRCGKTSTSLRARAPGRLKPCSNCFRGWPSVPTIAAINCPAASSRCWRSAAR